MIIIIIQHKSGVFRLQRQIRFARDIFRPITYRNRHDEIVQRDQAFI